jgi:hypothetical protein
MELQAFAEAARFGQELSAVEQLRAVEIEGRRGPRMLASEEPA